ncbi:MAG TPA: fumarylacetoacetate hydrolase family protein [Steroidobacteraceae bacterium]|nr:fumarylacetoacetate hydrolase family protein [Steroidobacteraceae bacterium]
MTDPAATRTIAQTFVNARRARAPLKRYPGPAPLTLGDAYVIQTEALALSSEAPAGWKIGRILGDDVLRFGDDRLSGPVFAGDIRTAVAGANIFSIIEGGFCAVEGEIIIRVGQDAPPGTLDWSVENASALIGACHVGVEIAGSPFAEINEHGPAVTASDFGNNDGLIIGPEIAVSAPWESPVLAVETRIDDVTVGRGNALQLPGGPVAALAWLASHLARRGLPLRRGQWVTTGAITGVHRIHPGQVAQVIFEGVGQILCLAKSS